MRNENNLKRRHVNNVIAGTIIMVIIAIVYLIRKYFF